MCEQIGGVMVNLLPVALQGDGLTGPEDSDSFDEDTYKTPEECMELCAPFDECVGFDWGMPVQDVVVEDGATPADG